MNEQRMILIDEISIDHMPVGPAAFRMAKHLEQGGTLSPIRVQRKRNGIGYKIVDGRVTVVAYMLLGRKSVMGTVIDAPRYPKGLSLHE